jgi:hypothetical protein
VARAKRTDRAEARRRYRAELAAEDGTEYVDDETGERAPAPPPQTRTSGSQMSSPSGRISFGTAFRLSIHPVNVREDIAALPWIALHTKALWLPLLITIVSAVAFTITSGTDMVTRFMFAYFVQTPAIGGVFLAGFLAPRASWLLGIIVGLVAAACYAAIILLVATGTPEEALARDAILSAFILSPVLGSVFAAGAAWYRRFLQLSNPNRGRRAAAAKKSTTDGRSRSAGSSKATSARR